MIITILCFALLVISFVLFCLGKKSYLCDNLSVGYLGLLGFFGFKWVYLFFRICQFRLLCVCACRYEE